MAVTMGNYSPKLREDEEARVLKIKLNTPLEKGYSETGAAVDGMLYQ